MKRSIFVTGVAGSGKTTLAKELTQLGYTAYDIEDDDLELFKMMREDTGEWYEDYDNADIEKVNNAKWICDKEKLREFVEEQKADIVFYCGIASNNDEIMPLFDLSILLRATPETIVERLKSREGTDDYGNTEAGRNHLLGWKDEFEDDMQKAGIPVVDANGDIGAVAREVVQMADKKALH